MFKIFGFFIICFTYHVSVISQPLSFGFSYGKNFAHTTTLMKAALAKPDEKELHAFPRNEYSLLLQYHVNDNNSFSLEPRLIERESSYHYYVMAGSYLNDGHYYLKNWEVLLKYSRFLFAVKKKLSFNFHLLSGYSHLIDYRLMKYDISTKQYFNMEPGKKDGIIIGYGLNLFYTAFNQRLRFFVSTSLSHLSIMNLYNVDCNIGILYNLKNKENVK